MSVIGRTKSTATINREIRRALNQHGATIAEKLLAKALTGDSVALAACSTLLIEVNRQPLPSKKVTHEMVRVVDP